MPDSKGELKRYATEYEAETGKRSWTNPVSHGEQGFASDDFLYWFAFALSTAEQRIEELEGQIIGFSIGASDATRKYNEACIVIVEADKVLTRLRAERERELREATDFCCDEFYKYVDSTYGLGKVAQTYKDAAWTKFLAHKEGK